jgi:hypothetical protein
VNRKRSVRIERADAQLLPRIEQIKQEHPAWGYRRVWSYLYYREGFKVNRKRVYRVT